MLVVFTLSHQVFLQLHLEPAFPIDTCMLAFRKYFWSWGSALAATEVPFKNAVKE